jgi:putative oxidoreductase
MPLTTRARIKYELPRIALGVIFLISGLNGFFEFVPAQQFSPEGNAFITHLKQSGFFWPLLSSAEIIGGVLLLFGSMGQVGVLVLAPICAGIVLFHTFLSPEGRWVAYGLFALEVAVIAIYWRNFAKIFAWSRRLTHTHSTR